MKTIASITLLTTLFFSAVTAADCTITLKKRTPGQKSAYIGEQSISAKVQEALATQCKIKIKMMSMNEIIKFEQKKYEKKLKKLKQQAAQFSN